MGTDFENVVLRKNAFKVLSIVYMLTKFFSSHMHAKPLFAHRLQTAKMASSRTRAQNNGPRAQNNGPWV